MSNHAGLKNPNSRLHPVLIQQIHEAHRRGLGYKRLAKLFLCSPSCIRDVLKGRTWIEYTLTDGSNKVKRPAPGEGAIIIG